MQVGFVVAKPLFRFLAITYILLELACFHMHLVHKLFLYWTVRMVADASQLLGYTRYFTTVSWRMFCPASYIPHINLCRSTSSPLPQKNCSKVMLPNMLFSCLFPDPSTPPQAWCQWWSRLCQLPHSRKEHKVGETELSSFQKVKGIH